MGVIMGSLPDVWTVRTMGEIVELELETTRDKNDEEMVIL